ncbi:MAG: flavodoxin [Bacteroidales bacterium]|nr:flavodoxin [Bacteroidales bacterium]
MDKIGIFYGSSMGYSEHVAHLIQQGFGAEHADVFNVTDATKEDLEKYKNIIYGCSSWGPEELQEDMEDFFHEVISKLDHNGRKVALFGLGDQEIYGKHFVESLGILYAELKDLNADLIGEWSTDGYEFEFSEAAFDGKFVGLVVDEENQEDLTVGRVEQWVAQLKKEFI